MTLGQGIGKYDACFILQAKSQSLTPHKQEIKMFFIFIFLKKSRMDQKEQSRIQVPDKGQKVAIKVCRRKIRVPYYLVSKTVPNINT